MIHSICFRSISLSRDAIGRRKLDLSVEESVHEEESTPSIKAIAVVNQEVGVRLRARLSRIEEVTGSEAWKGKIKQMSELFEAQKRDFLDLLETQPGFLQSSFLGLHRKLREKYF